MIVISRRSASHIASAVLPDAVGPQMTGMIGGSGIQRSAPTKAPFELIPRQMNDGGPAVHVVRGQLAVAQRDEQRAHLLLRHRVACFDCGLARHGGGEVLMPRRSRGAPISRQSGNGV